MLKGVLNEREAGAGDRGQQIKDMAFIASRLEYSIRMADLYHCWKEQA